MNVEDDSQMRAMIVSLCKCELQVSVQVSLKAVMASHVLWQWVDAQVELDEAKL